MDLNSVNTEKTKKELILNSALKLFYEQGYNSTTFDQIAALADVNKPLITYHFGTKASLANCIHVSISRNIKNKVALKNYEQFGLIDAHISAAIDMRVLEFLYAKDIRANRFYMESYGASMEFLSKENAHLDTGKYTAIYRYKNKNNKIDKDEALKINIASIINITGALSLHVAYYNNLLQCNFDDFLDHLIEYQFLNMGFDEEERIKILIESKRIFSLLPIKYNNYFDIE